MGMNLTADFGDVRKLEKTINKVGKISQKSVNKAASKGATVVRKAIRTKTPKGKTGELKKGIIRNGERSRVRGKKTYDFMFDPKKNVIFQKRIDKPHEFGGKGLHAYYPASMEYGFLTRSKGGGLSYVRGHYFMRDATIESASDARAKIVNTMTEELERAWKK